MSIISITDKGKTITYHAHHMRDVIEPVKQYGMLALLKIGGQFPYPWIWVLAPIWIPLLALAGITIILIIAWIIGVIGVLILEKFGD